MKIYAFHLLNDYSGSPKVLMQLVKGWVRHGHKVHLVTCSGGRGFLSDLPGVSHHTYWYRWAPHPVRRLVNFATSQVLLFFTFLAVVKKQDVVYINTVLPFGAAVMGKLKGCRVVYHVHETSVAPRLLKKVLFGFMRWTASDVVYVSEYLAEQEPAPGAQAHLLPNAIENNFLQTARSFTKAPATPQHVLMVCSLKTYKGVYQFVRLAGLNSHLNFRLVVNANRRDIDGFFATTHLPENLEIFDVQTDLHPFYRWADIVVNLSMPDRWIETFGLTILEGMAYGLPAIVPTVGGITEIVSQSVNGYHADARDLEMLTKKLRMLCTPDLYKKMRQNALSAIGFFSEDSFISASLNIIERTADGMSFHAMERLPGRAIEKRLKSTL